MRVFYKDIKTAKYGGRRKFIKCFGGNMKRDGCFVHIDLKKYQRKNQKIPQQMTFEFAPCCDFTFFKRISLKLEYF